MLCDCRYGDIRKVRTTKSGLKYCAVMISYGRSGTIWLRTIFDKAGYNIRVTHNPSRHRAKKYVKYNVPIALLARDPRDIMVSYWHFFRFRFPFDPIDRMNLWEFTKSSYGLGRSIGFFNHLANSTKKFDFCLVRYEDMVLRFDETIKTLFLYLGLSIDQDVVDAAKAITSQDIGNIPYISTKKNLKITERPSDASLADVRCRHSRRAEVGAWKEYYSKDQIDWINSQMLRLNPVYEYS